VLLQPRAFGELLLELACQSRQLLLEGLGVGISGGGADRSGRG
jgi:hypothetical protein